MALFVRLFLLNVLTALTYVGTGWVSLQAAIAPDYIAIVFLPAGVALGAVLAGGYRLLPGVLLGALAVHALALHQMGALHWSPMALVSPVGAAFMAWFTAWAIRRWVGYPSALDHPRDAVRVFFILIPACTAINASLSVPVLVATGVVGMEDALFSWWTWWLADTLGAVLLTPLVLVCYGQPAKAWRTRIKTVALPMALAMLLVAGMLQLLHTQQERALETQFVQTAQDLALRLQRRLDAQTDSVIAVAKLMEKATDMDQKAFASATGLWLERYPGTQNFGWSPLITHKQREDYENILPAWPIMGRTLDGHTRIAPPADAYLPITWVVPLHSNRAVLGLDVNVLPTTQAAVAATVRSGRPHATEGLRLVQEARVQRAVVVYQAVRQRNGAIQGVVSAAFRMDDVLETALPTINWVGLCLIDWGAPAGNQRLSGPDGCELPRTGRGQMEHSVQSLPVQFAGRNWVLLVQAHDVHWSKRTQYGAWVSTAVGLLAVSMLGTFLIVITGQTRRTAQLVEERTHDLARSNASLVHLAHFDALTGLANRNYWTQQAQATLDAAQLNGKLVGVLFLDLDRFKHVNDSLGHSQGDLLLVTVSARIQACLRARDVLARMGGDEFVALLPWLRDLQGAATVARKVAQALAEPIVLDGMQVTITGSVGVAIYPEHGATVEELLRHADTAMYAAKAAGRNQWRFFEPAMHERVSRRLAIESGLRAALEEAPGQLSLVYQPLVDARSAQVLGLEALLRWQHPTLGAIAPHEFVQVAEESGLIEGLGRWVLHGVCQQIQAWADGPQAHRFATLRVAVNVSAIEFNRPLFLEHLHSALGQMQQPAHRLELEITESLLLHAGADLNQRMQHITALGIGLSLDDFGTGYSSLGYLKRLPLHKLKIDRSFIIDVPGNPEDEAIVRATLSMAHDLGLDVVAEGVENQAQRDFLTQHGCDAFQGWLFARAMPAADLAPWLLNRGAV